LIYTDSIRKKFLSSGGFLNPNDKMSNYQDPTYLGFTIKIVDSLNDINDLDSLPHGLFCVNGEKNDYSAIKYLETRGETLRANYLREFEYLFKKILIENPWYFTKISGIGELWKLDPKQNFRAKEKKITIETMESLDLRITMLLDLYRKAVFDSQWMRWAVPENLRFFKMNIIISETRLLKIQEKTRESIYGKGYIIDETFSSEGLDYPGASSLPWTTGTFIKLSLEQCEIDITDAVPPFLEGLGTGPENMAVNKFSIKFGKVSEKNVYGLLGAIVEETKNWLDYTKNNMFFPSEVATKTDKPNTQIPREIVEESFYPTDYVSGEKARKNKYKEFFPENPQESSEKIMNFNFNNIFKNQMSLKDFPNFLEKISLSPQDKINLNILKSEFNNLNVNRLLNDSGSIDLLLKNTAKSFENYAKGLTKLDKKKFEAVLSKNLGTNINVGDSNSILKGLQKFAPNNIFKNNPEKPEKTSINLEKNDKNVAKDFKKNILELKSGIQKNLKINTLLKTGSKIEFKKPKI